MDQAALAKRIEVTPSRLSNWERDISLPKAKSPYLGKIAHELGVSLEFLSMGTPVVGAQNATLEQISYPVALPLVPVPYIGFMPAGVWVDPLETEDSQELDARFAGKGRFCGRVAGESMMELLEPNDLVTFQAYHFGEKPRGPLIGDILYAKCAEGGAVKQLRHDGQDFRLHSLNTNHDEAKADTWEGIGYLVGIQREDRGELFIRYNPEGLKPMR